MLEMIKKYEMKIDKEIIENCKVMNKTTGKDKLKNKMLKRRLLEQVKENFKEEFEGRKIDVKKIFKCEESRIVWVETYGDNTEFEEIIIVIEVE